MNKYVGRDMSDLDQSGMRVVANRAGETIHAAGLAKQCREAMENLDPRAMDSLSQINPVIVFIRKDGWMLAANQRFEKVAYNMWQDEWVGFCAFPNEIVSDIEDYVMGEYGF